MFEKEAVEYAEGMAKYYQSAHDYIPSQFEKYLRKAVEYGYSKANEWHYPSKGEYPKECENVWCYCKGPGIKFCCVGHTIVGGDNKVRWWANNKTEELRIVAWKEIILPELPKESK